MTSDEQRAASGPGAERTNGTTEPATTHPADGPTDGATDPDRLDLLDRYWDATTGNGFQRAGAIALDPVRTRTVDLLQNLTHDQTAGIPAAARARIWRETVATAGIPTRQESPVTASALSGHGAATPNLTLPAGTPPRGHRPPPGGPVPHGGGWSVPGGGPSQPTGRTWWPRLQFAVAAALILGLFATILAPMDDGRVSLFGGIGGDATPTADSAANTIPSIGYPEAFTGGGLLVDLPVSASGHLVSIDRVSIAEGATLTLPPGAVHQVASVTGRFTVERASGSSPLTVDQPGIIDIDADSGSILADQGEDVTVTVLTIAPDGAALLTSTDGVTVYPLANDTIDGLRFDSLVNVLFGNGPVPVDPEPVGPSAIPDDPTNLTDPGAMMLLYAERGSIRITASADVIRTRESSPETPTFVSELTIAAGETAVVSNPSLATIREATPGESAVYTVAFLAPPALDRTEGRTYPNTPGGGSGLQPALADGDDYRIVLDRLTLNPGATAAFPVGTFRAVQWTGGGLATMTSDDAARPPVVFDERSLNASFEDQGVRIAATGDTPVTLTLMSYLPAGSSEETVPGGQTGLTAERLSVYTATDPFDADHLRFTFYAAEAAGFPVDLAPWIDLDLTGGSAVDAYALVRPEGGPIVLNRPARRIVGGAETTEIAAGNAVVPGETVRVDDLRDATLQGATDGTPAGYTIVVVSPDDEPAGTGPNADTAPVTGLTPADLDTVASVPADQPLTLELVRQTLAPDMTLTISPVAGTDGLTVPPITVLSYAATGDATISLAGGAGTELSDRSDQVAMRSLTASTPITIRAGADGITIYQLVIATARPEYTATGTDGTSVGVVLGTYSGNELFGGSGAAGQTVDIEVALRSSVDALGDGGSGTLGRDSAITLLTPLAGSARITPGTGEVRIVDAAGGDRSGAATTIPTTIAPGGGLVALPGGLFRVAAETDSDTLSYLWAEIRVSAPAPAGTPVATPAVGTPAPGTPAEGKPAASGAVACDITPRTVEELLALYDDGIAQPVDPLALSHRDDSGTGTPAGDETIAAVTDTLSWQSACQNLGDPLRQYALYSDEALRYLLPVIYASRDEVASLLAQPPAEASAAATGNVTVSDVELFADGRVGARVALDGEFAYVTFTQAADGTWLMDVFDDRYEPGA